MTHSVRHYMQIIREIEEQPDSGGGSWKKGARGMEPVVRSPELKNYNYHVQSPRGDTISKHHDLSDAIGQANVGGRGHIVIGTHRENPSQKVKFDHMGNQIGVATDHLGRDKNRTVGNYYS